MGHLPCNWAAGGVSLALHQTGVLIGPASSQSINTQSLQYCTTLAALMSQCTMPARCIAAAVVSKEVVRLRS